MVVVGGTGTVVDGNWEWVFSSVVVYLWSMEAIE